MAWEHQALQKEQMQNISKMYMINNWLIFSVADLNALHVSQIRCEWMNEHKAALEQNREYSNFTYTTSWLTLFMHRAGCINIIWWNDIGGCFIYTPSGRIALLMQTVLMGKSQCPSWWKQGKGTIKRGTMSDNNSVGTSNPSFQAPDVWIPTKSSVYVWQTSVCRHTTVTIMLLITLILCWDLSGLPWNYRQQPLKLLTFPLSFLSRFFPHLNQFSLSLSKYYIRYNPWVKYQYQEKKMCARLPEM